MTLSRCLLILFYKDLRESQLQVINATLSRRNVFVLMKTGGGKTLCYQLPALLESKGITLVIAPLVSLIRDQVRCMNEVRKNSATYLAGKMELPDQRKIYNEISSTIPDNELRLVYVTPEKINQSKMLMTHLQKAYDAGRLNRIVIDEAHCASQWGKQP